MDIICTCSACQAKFKVGEHAAGKKARCPKCAAVTAVPSGEAASSAPVPPAAAPARAVTVPAAPPPRPAVPPARSPAEVFSQPSQVPLFATKDEPGGARLERRGKRKGLPLPILLAVGGSVAVVAVIGLIVALTSSGTPPQAEQQPAKTSTLATLVVDWPEAERGNATLSLNGKPTAVPATGAIQLKVKPGKHVVGILRKDYEPTRDEVTVARGETALVRPQWKEVVQVAGNQPGATVAETPSGFPLGTGIVIPGFEGWQQVLAIAKDKAANEKKDVLIVFGSSDGNPDTGRLAAALKNAGLPGGALGEKFVPLVIDFPETGTGMNQIMDRRQNRKLMGEYAIDDQLPVVALADDQGRPYAIQREWPGGVGDAAQVVETLQSRRQERDDLLAATKTGTAPQQLDAAVAFIKWLNSHKLLVQYREDIHPWWALATKEDPVNTAGKQEVILEAEMMCKLTDLPEDVGRVEIVQRLDLMEPWLKDRRFADADRGFKLHFLAGNILGRMGEEDVGIAHIERAASYEPQDPDLKAARESVAGLSRNILSSGTGFVVAEGGYILTNKHVVDGPGRVAVRIAGVKEPVAAKSVKLHEKLDVALVQIDLPESYQPQPVGLNAGQLNRGLEVGAFGYPQGDALGEDLKFTKGAVSSLPNASLDNMILLDLRINPGNSGGPLCDVQGNVIGMITAKTSGLNLDSYGMAIPAAELDKFLAATLPEGTQRGVERDAKANTWAEVDAAISPAVLMVVKLR